MSTIKLTLTEPIRDGMEVKFRAPCACSEVTGITVTYYVDNNDTAPMSLDFEFYDAHGNNISNLGNLFSEGVLVKVMLDYSEMRAYILNADTNAYLEGKLGGEETTKGAGTIESANTISSTYCYWKKTGDLIFATGRFTLSGLSGSSRATFTIKDCGFSSDGYTLFVSSVNKLTIFESDVEYSKSDYQDVCVLFSPGDGVVNGVVDWPSERDITEITVDFGMICTSTSLRV